MKEIFRCCRTNCTKEATHLGEYGMARAVISAQQKHRGIMWEKYTITTRLDPYSIYIGADIQFKKISFVTYHSSNGGVKISRIQGIDGRISGQWIIGDRCTTPDLYWIYKVTPISAEQVYNAVWEKSQKEIKEEFDKNKVYEEIAIHKRESFIEF